MEENPLGQYFDALSTGPGVWKWRHYFEIYHQHFQKFVGRERVRVLEIGIYSGGSLQMWRHYFGEGCEVYGVDIMPECKAYENQHVKVFIGDQSDREFWQWFRNQTPPLDIIIDDGGHELRQQVPTFEELLPHLAPGGVYLCEDVIGTHNSFAAYMAGLAYNLNAAFIRADLQSNERRQASVTTRVQAEIESVAFHPYVTVVQRRSIPLTELVSSKHGTEWQPFAR
jgi:SAM-dependent methyltransferase